MHADPDPKPDGDAIANCNAHAYWHPDFGRSNTDAGGVPDSHRNAQYDCHSNRNLPAIRHGAADAISDLRTFYCNGDRNLHTVVHQHSDADGHGHTFANSHADTGSDSQLHTRGGCRLLVHQGRRVACDPSPTSRLPACVPI